MPTSSDTVFTAVVFRAIRPASNHKRSPTIKNTTTKAPKHFHQNKRAHSSTNLYQSNVAIPRLLRLLPACLRLLSTPLRLDLLPRPPHQHALHLGQANSPRQRRKPPRPHQLLPHQCQRAFRRDADREEPRQRLTLQRLADQQAGSTFRGTFGFAGVAGWTAG